MGVTMQRIIEQIMPCVLSPVGMLWYKTTKWAILVVALCVSLVWHVLYMFGTSGEYHFVWFNDSACTYQTVGGKLQINGVVLKHYRRHRAVNECVGEKSVHVMSINTKVVTHFKARRLSTKTWRIMIRNMLTVLSSFTVQHALFYYIDCCFVTSKNKVLHIILLFVMYAFVYNICYLYVYIVLYEKDVRRYYLDVHVSHLLKPY